MDLSTNQVYKFFYAWCFQTFNSICRFFFNLWSVL